MIMFRINFYYNSQLKQPFFNRPTHEEIEALIANLRCLNKVLNDAKAGQVESALNRVSESKNKPGLLNNITMLYHSLMKKSFILHSQENKSSDTTFLKFSLFTSVDEQNRLLEWNYKNLDYICLNTPLENLLRGLKFLTQKSLATYQHFENTKHARAEDFNNIYVVINKLYFTLQDRIREENNILSGSTEKGSYKPPVV